MPGTHAVQADAPVERELYEPEVQTVAAVMPVVGQNVPSGHVEHADAPAAENNPTAHCSPTVRPVLGHSDPAGHGVHTVRLVVGA